MLKIDSHQHYWLYHPVKDAWITDDLKAIQKDLLPAEVWPIMQQHGIAGCVAVQADQSEQENDFLLELARENSFIKGIVGWVDLQAANIEERLQYYDSMRTIKGFRHILQGEQDKQFMLGAKFMHGISLLDRYGFSYDVLIRPDHLPYAKQLVAAFPNQRFVVDHLAKPFIKDKILDNWQQDIQAIAELPNVHCKVSGMITEADWQQHTPADFETYLDVVFNAFGVNRVIFGSDWPVCNLAGGYSKAVNTVEGYVDKLTLNEQQLFWAGNAIAFYKLDL